LSKKDTDMMRFSNRMDSLSESNDTRKIDNEKIFLIRNVEDVQNEIFQLENNIQFFAKAKKDNPMVLEVMKNIEHQKEELATWKEKLKQIRQM
jgi:seryl-tRNA synthetase